MASVETIPANPMKAKVQGLMQGSSTEAGTGQKRPNLANRGVSVPDLQAIGPDQIRKNAWLDSRKVDLNARVKVIKLSHMRYQHPDLVEINQFLKDFGMSVVKDTGDECWYRGYGPDQYVYYARKGPKQYLGGAFEVESREELEKILQIPNVQVLSNGVEDMLEAPGGGSIVTVSDPEGYPVNFVHGQESLQTTHPVPERLLVNDETHKPRQRKFQRFEPGPAEIYKLGHFGMVTLKFEELLDWYTRYFNFVPSDILYIPKPGSSADDPDRIEVAMFAHIDRGDDLVDHHTLFLSSAVPGGKKHVHHCSFEIHDFDTQALGHQWLTKKGYNPVWGVGRHILGSQIFDYWWDTTGNMVEHYADGDLVNIQTPMGFAPAGHEGLAVWGPEVPKAFLD